jgi:hypothetical protein
MINPRKFLLTHELCAYAIRVRVGSVSPAYSDLITCSFVTTDYFSAHNTIVLYTQQVQCRHC